MTITMLGSGTSSGVPTIGCGCSTCMSADPHDRRTRPSIWVQHGKTSVIIDTSSDFRQQCLQNGVKRLDAVIYTHHHFDHISGFDDLRAFNFTSRRAMPIYLMPETLIHIRNVFSYAFAKQPGLSSIPYVDIHEIDESPFIIEDIQFEPLRLVHGPMRVNGYRFGNVAYCTDCNNIPEATIERMRGLDILILDALRHTPHPTHFTLDQAIEMALNLGARRTYFTHIAHDILHKDVQSRLPSGVYLSYDGLTLESPYPNFVT